MRRIGKGNLIIAHRSCVKTVAAERSSVKTRTSVFVLWSVFVFCLVCKSFVSAMTVDELQKKMMESEKSLKSLSFDFVQETHSAVTMEKRESSGTAYVKKPKQLRIEQNEPEKQLLVSDGKTVYVYTPRFNQVVKDSWKKWFSKNLFFPGMTGFSEMLQKLKEDYQWEIGSADILNGEKTIAVLLRNNRVKNGDERLKLWLGENDFIPRKTEFVSGTLTLTTTLISLRLNEELKQQLFKFNRPAQSEIIQMP